MAIAVEGAVTLLLVYDVPTAIAFYRDILGFTVVQTSTLFDDGRDNYGWAMLQHGSVQLMLNNMYENNVRPTQPDAARAAAHRDTAIYFTCRDVDAVYAYLRSRGVDASEPVVTYYGMRQVHVTDPDGYSLVFQQPGMTLARECD